MPRIEQLALLALFISKTALPLLAQASLGTGSIHGVVVDLSDRVVSGARAELIDTERDITRQALSNLAGVFVFPDIPAATYNLRISMEGFETVELMRVRLDVGQTASLQVVLRPGEIRSVVTVTAEERDLIETQSNVLGTVVDTERVRNLPLNGRNFLRLSLLAAGSNEPVGRSSIIPFQLGLPDRGVVIAGNLAYMTRISDQRYSDPWQSSRRIGSQCFNGRNRSVQSSGELFPAGSRSESRARQRSDEERIQPVPRPNILLSEKSGLRCAKFFRPNGRGSKTQPVWRRCRVARSAGIGRGFSPTTKGFARSRLSPLLRLRQHAPCSEAIFVKWHNPFLTRTLCRRHWDASRSLATSYHRSGLTGFL